MGTVLLDGESGRGYFRRRCGMYRNVDVYNEIVMKWSFGWSLEFS